MALTAAQEELVAVMASTVPNQKMPALLDSVAAITDLNQDISATYAEAEVQAISDKVDELLAALRALGWVA